MSKVITFSRVFPSYHPKAGQPTHFIEKIYKSILKPTDHVPITGIEQTLSLFALTDATPKHTTIRAGHRWKASDWFRPVVWGDDINPKSGRKGPYNSKQITFAPDIEIKKVWDFKIIVSKKREPIWLNETELGADMVGIIAHHDGLSFVDFMHWFKYPGTPFDGQIICWNENIEY